MSRNLPVKMSPEDMIVRVRGHAVILDADLARLYGVETRTLNQQVKRHIDRFPSSFAFQMSEREWKSLRSQSVISKGRGGRRYPPYVFSEHGVLMAANILNSKKAVKTSVALVEAFLHLRRMALSVEAVARKLNCMEKKYDKQFQVVFNAIRKLISAPPTKQVKGFSQNKK